MPDSTSRRSPRRYRSSVGGARGVDASLCTSLSQVLVAYTIEFDNEFELRLSKTWARPFLTSIVAWGHVMRHVPEEGITVEELARRSLLARGALASFLGGMERWNYVRVQEDPSAPEPPHRAGYGTARGIKPTSLVRPSVTGEMAQRQWAPLAGEIEERWRERFGVRDVQRLAGALNAVHARAGRALPRFLPVLNAKGLFAEPVIDAPSTEGETSLDRDAWLPTLLSQVLLAYTLDYESDAPVSLPIASNLLRVLTVEPIAVGQLPSLAGISKEAVATSATWLQNAGLIVQATAAASRGKVLSLTPAGVTAQLAHSARLQTVEQSWNERLGSRVVGELRSALEAILKSTCFSAGLVSPPGGWRAKGRYATLTEEFVEHPRDALPHYPMVLHRGGWPDGS